MKFSTGMGDLVAAVEPIYANAMVTPEMAAVMYARTARGEGMGRLGCTNPRICWDSAWNGGQTRGADVDYALVGLNGVGDFQPAQFVVPENPIMRGAGQALAGLGCQNGLINGLRGLRGLGAFDTSSLSNFATSVESGSSTLFGITLPNYVWLGGGVLLASMLAGGARRGRR